MKPAKFCTILVVSLLAMACAQAPGNNAAATANLAASVNETGAAPASTATAAPANSAAPAMGPLSAYVGKLTSDAVGGSTFLARPEVRGAVESLVQDPGARRWLLNPDTTQSPIEMR